MREEPLRHGCGVDVRRLLVLPRRALRFRTMDTGRRICATHHGGRQRHKRLRAAKSAVIRPNATRIVGEMVGPYKIYTGCETSLGIKGAFTNIPLSNKPARHARWEAIDHVFDEEQTGNARAKALAVTEGLGDAPLECNIATGGARELGCQAHRHGASHVDTGSYPNCPVSSSSMYEIISDTSKKMFRDDEQRSIHV